MKRRIVHWTEQRITINIRVVRLNSLIERPGTKLKRDVLNKIIVEGTGVRYISKVLILNNYHRPV